MSLENKTIDCIELGKKYNMGTNFFRTIMCRPEFNKLQVPKTVGKARTLCNYKDCKQLYKMIDHVIYLKKR